MTNSSEHYTPTIPHLPAWCKLWAVFTIQPAFSIRYKRYETDAIEKLMTLLFITEDSYRMAGVSQALGMDTEQAGNWTALEQSQAIQPRALWALVQWFGQLSPAQLNLALGVAPPQYILEDEKHVKEGSESPRRKQPQQAEAASWLFLMKRQQQGRRDDRVAGWLRGIDDLSPGSFDLLAILSLDKRALTTTSSG